MKVDPKTVLIAASLATQLVNVVVDLVRTSPEVARREELRKELEELRERRRKSEIRREESDGRRREAFEAELLQVNAEIGQLRKQLQELQREIENEEAERRNRQLSETAEEFMEEHSEAIEDLNNKFDTRAENLEENYQKLKQGEVEQHQKRIEIMGTELEEIREEGKQTMKKMNEVHEEIYESRFVLLTEHSERLEVSDNILHEKVMKEMKLAEERKSKLHAERGVRYIAHHNEQMKQINQTFGKIMEHYKEESSRQLMENTEKWIIRPVTNLHEALLELNFEIQRVEEGTKEEDWNFESANNKLQRLLGDLKYKKSKLYEFIFNSSNKDADQKLRNLVNKLNQNVCGVLLLDAIKISKSLNLALETKNYDKLTRIKDDIGKLEQNVYISIANFQTEALH